MRRILTTTMLTLLAMTGALAVPVATSGATTLPVGHLLHGSAAPAPATRSAHTAAPISSGYFASIDQSGNPTVASGIVTASGVSPNMLGVTMVGLSATVSVTINSSIPVTAGGTYGTGGTGDVTVTAPGFNCDSANGDSLTLAKVDQAAFNGTGQVTTIGIQFACIFGSGNGLLIYGALAYNMAPSTPHQGYYTYEADGQITGYGNDNFLNYLGNLAFTPLNQPIVGMAQTADGAGYWMVASDGGIFAFGDATFYGSMGGTPLNKPIVGMAATPDGHGYWLVASDGGIFAFGDARFYGSMGGSPLTQPFVGMAANPSGGGSGRGYWLVAADGGIFAFGRAPFYGSTGAIHLNQPIVGMAATPNGAGYRFVAADGGIFCFGDALFHGSTGNITLAQPIVGMASTPTGSGYWLVADDGGIFAFNASYYGSLPGDGTSVTDVVGLSA